jgi:cation:H+ antiporter
MQVALLSLGALVLGAGLLYLGAEWLVRGAAGMALRLGVRPLLIGLTVVSYATSAPELMVSVAAALRGSSDIALANVVGSNIANLGLILGLTVLIAPPRTDGSMAGRELWVLAAATAALPLLLLDEAVGRLEGLVLVGAALAFTWLTIRWSKARGAAEEELPEVASGGSGRLVAVGAVGLAMLIAGGEVFVWGAVSIAEGLGISARVIGLTVVAVGTSLPELAASLVAALRGHSDLAIGNVIGSNIFNLLLILGAAALVRPVGASLGTMALDVVALLAFTGFLLLLLRKPRTLGRLEGGVLTAGYCSFLVVLGLGAFP